MEASLSCRLSQSVPIKGSCVEEDPVSVDNDVPSLLPWMPSYRLSFVADAPCHPAPVCSEKAARWESLNSNMGLMGQVRI